MKRLILLILALVFLTGCSGLDDSLNDEETEFMENCMEKQRGTIMGEMDYVNPIDKKDHCYYALSMEMKDPELCGLIENSQALNDCIYVFATRTNNETLCERLDNEGEEMRCKDLISPKMMEG
ncbi:MAG: lipoprotein [Nanobdellota archaeon]